MELEHARSRNASIYGEILGYDTSFDPKSKNIYSPKTEGVTEVIQYAFEESKVSKETG